MRRAAPWLVTGLGLLLVVAGAVVFAVAGGGGQVVYEGSYEPLSSSAYSSTTDLASDDAVVWTRAHLAGPGLAGAGAVLLAAVGGRRGSAASS
ncbi:hypothetical protein [Geodermatophilus chilensis]|uniref:hypothetical protein n=1 Tax=Geodermatophilus chilensis TaxID=2035835 RepID=UPI000C260A65|nr:hypothetical protein [Geodermatophilus chilensis]